MAGVPKVLGEGLAPEFLGTNQYVSGKGVTQEQHTGTSENLELGITGSEPC